MKTKAKATTIEKKIEIFVDNAKKPRLIINLDQGIFLAKSIKMENELLHKHDDLWAEQRISDGLKSKFNMQMITRFGGMDEVEQVIALNNPEFERILFIMYGHEKVLERENKYYPETQSMYKMVKSIIECLKKN